jgi:processive 1,2-diacylglycerol beta-glucosyltransferase
MWPHYYTDMFCVATESMAETLRARKVEDARIKLTGIPVRADFKESANKAEKNSIKEKWNVPEGKQLALVLAGATLPQPYVRMRAILDKALLQLKQIDDVEWLFLTGKDEDYANKLKSRLEAEGMQNARATGYVDDIAKLMAASDFMVCKAGGLTVTECLCTETPMLLVGRAYGQEKANVNLLTAMGAAMHVQTPRELGVAAAYIASNPHARDAMVGNEQYLRRPDAARVIAEATLQLADASFDELPEDERLRRTRHPFMWFYWGHQPAHTR